MPTNRPNQAIYLRKALEVATRRLQAARGLVVNGPRQAGKTSLLQVLHSSLSGEWLSLDDSISLESAKTDPTGIVETFKKPLFVDEVQRAGDPFVLAVKSFMDRHQDKGQFVLAGSTRFLTEPRLSESLAGRVRFVDLWPLSQGEIDDTPDRFVDTIFAAPDNLGELTVSPISRQELFERVTRGGFPEAATAATVKDRVEFLADYIRTVTSKDLRELADIEHVANLGPLVRSLAARSGTEINAADLGREIGIPLSTMRRYIALFDTLYLHYLIPAWSTNELSKIIHRPKLHFVDSGLAAYLSGSNAEELVKPLSSKAGRLLETFVASELSRQLTWSEVDASIYHFRDRNGAEVDIVLETMSGLVAGIEVKAASSVNTRDFRHLILLRDRLGDRFVCGVVLHCGDRIIPFGPKMFAMPVSALWQLGLT